MSQERPSGIVDIGDPQIKWICQLIDELKFLRQLIYSSKYMESERQIRLIIGSLNEEAQRKATALLNFKFLRETDYEIAYAKLYAFLHENYLQGHRYAKPKYGAKGVLGQE